MKKYFALRSIITCLLLSFVFQSFGQQIELPLTGTDENDIIFAQTAPPTGEVRFPAEFEPVQSVMVVYPLNLPWSLIQELAEDDSNVKVIVVVNKRKNSSTAESAEADFIANNVNVNNCEFIEASNDYYEDGINSHWIRDFGPWYIFEDGEPAIVDNLYNRSFVDDNSEPIENPTYNNTRWRDDKFARTYAANNNTTLYGMPVVHTGGNMMQDGRGVGVSDLIVHTQSETFLGQTKEVTNQMMSDYLGIDTYHVTIDPQGDYIAHVDCWGKLLAPDKILIAKVLETNEQYDEYEEVASYFETTNCCWGYPYKVYRVNVPVDSKENIADDDKIAPYTNSLIVNKKVFVPISSLTNTSYNEDALQVYREAMPGYEIIGVDYILSDEYGPYAPGWKNTDALHCRTREIMDFDMLFVDHREVLHEEVAQKDSYPITAKFIAYSGDAITSTQLYYRINDGDWQTVNMTQVGTSDEYTANITGCNVGDNVKYYLTGEDASGRTCAQPIFEDAEPHTFTVVENTGSEPEPESITLEANPITITANGTDQVTFTVWQGTTDVTSQCEFYQVVGTGSQIAANPFTTTTAGTYEFYATLGSGTEALESNTVTITATTPVVEDITIAFSKDTFVADGEDFITVTVWQGTTDVTSECDIYYEYNSKHTQYTEDKFTTTNAGTYTFYANKGELWSDDYPITATTPVVTPSIDLTKYYRIKSVSQEKYLHIKGYNGAHATNSHGDVGLATYEESNDQIFKLVAYRDGNYTIVSANGYSIVCGAANGYNVDAYNNSASTLGIEWKNETQFYILNGTNYFKVGADSQGNGYYPYCDADLNAAETWTLEEATVPVVLSADKDAITANNTDQVTFTVMQGIDDLTNEYEIWYGTTRLNGYTFTTTTAGTYDFYAMKGTSSTNIVTITATEPEGSDEPEPEPGDETIEYIEISGNTSSSSKYVPVYLFANYSISQQYYLDSEIKIDDKDIENAIIKSISFSCGNIQDQVNDYFTTHIVVYMRNTDNNTSFFSGTTMEQMNKSEIVYSGDVTFTSNTWCEITLQNEFEYTGNNILLCVWEDKEGYTYYDSYFNTFANNDNRVLYKNSSNGGTVSNPIETANTNCTSAAHVPQVKFGILSEPEDPIVLHIDKETILANGEDKVTFTVTQGEDTGTGNSVTNECTFYVNDEAFGGNIFTCTEAGPYEVYAMKGNLKSNTETFTAVYPIVLTADKTSIYNNNTDAITFSVKQGVDEAQGAKIYYIYNNSTTLFSGNTFKTATAGYYEFFATYTDADYGVMESNHINVTVNIEPLEDSDEVITNNGDGSVSITYNKGELNEYTLIARLIDPDDTSKGAYIVQDNVYEYGTGEQYGIDRKDNNKPKAETMLMMPETVPFGTEEVTVTRVENYAFDNLFEYYNYSNYNPGNPLNNNFTGVIIPGTIKELGMYSFAFETETKVVCYAMTPPTVYIDEKEGEIFGQGYFLQNTYDNIILYVPVNCVDTYKQTPGWGLPLSDGTFDECYFKNIYPIETPTFIGEGSWDEVANWDPTYGFPEVGEDVLINGNAVIEAGSVANVGEIYIIAGSGSITMKDGGQLIHTNANVEVTVEKEIKGYGEGVSWYTISSPLVNNEPATEVTNLLSNNYDLYYYNEPTHYWFNYKDIENNANFTTIDPARGYLYANSNDVTLQFTGAVNHKEEVSFNLDMKDNILVGFNLIGNPFTHNIYKGKGAAIDNDNLTIGHYSLSNAGRWGAVLSNSEAIAPCQSILVQTIKDDETLVIRKKNNAPTVRDEHATLDIVVSNGKYSDEAHVMFTEGIGLGKIAHMNKDIPMVYVSDNGSHYAIATMEEDVEEIAVGFEAMTMGEYTIGIKAADCDYSSIILTDNITGEKTDLLKGNYTFMALTTDRPQRFVLTMNNDIDTDTDTDFIYINNNNEMVISNIKGNGQVMIYDIMGRPMAEYNVSGSANISVESFASGVYIVRMTDDNGVKSQKIVLN